MPNEIHRLEQETQRNQAQSDAAREAEQRIQEAQDLPLYQQVGDGSYQRQFTDRQGRDITLRVDGNDAQRTGRVAGEQRLESQQSIRIRAADTAEASKPPTFKDKGQIGYANTSLEISRDVNGSETDRRLRLQDIKTNDNYEANGIGSQMLSEAERAGQQRDAREVYGNYVPEAGKEAATRHWYQTHGFEFRPKSGGGEEVYKTLAEPNTDAAAIRREVRR
jgi:ribosomal protein S18 acetylase RimI-like enzyme